MVEGAPLLRECARDSTEGSNPFLSATFFTKYFNKLKYNHAKLCDTMCDVFRFPRQLSANIQYRIDLPLVRIGFYQRAMYVNSLVRRL